MGVAAHSPLASLNFLRGGKNHRGLGKMSRHFFFSVFVIIKSSDGIRSRRKGRGDVGAGGGQVSTMGSSSSSFLARKSRGNGKFKGRKVQNQARKMGQKNKKTKK